MSVMPDLEDLTDSVLNLFKSDFADTLATINAAKTTVINPLTPPIMYYFGGTKNLPQMPCMIVNAKEADPEDDENYDWRKIKVPMEIEAYYQFGDVQTLSRIIKRYGVAIDKLLNDNPTINGAAAEILNIRQIYSDPLNVQGALMQVVNVSFDVYIFTN